MRTPYDVLRSLRRYTALVLDELAPDINGDDEDWEVRTDDDQAAVHFPYVLISPSTPRPTVAHRTTPTQTMGVQIAAYAGPGDTVDAAQRKAYAIEEALWQGFAVGAGHLPAPSAPDAQTLSPGALPSATYSYVLTAVTRRGETTGSAPVAINVLSGGARLSWPWIGGAQFFRLYRGVVAGSERLLWQGAATSYDDYGGTTLSPRPVPAVNTALLGMPFRVPLYDYDGVDAEGGASDALNRPSGSDYLRIVDFNIRHMEEPDDKRNVAVVVNLRGSWLRSSLDPMPGSHVAAAGRIFGP